MEAISVDWDTVYAPENFNIDNNFDIKRTYIAYCYNSECIKKHTKKGRPKRIAIAEAKKSDTFCPRCGYAMKWVTEIEKIRKR